MHWLANMPEDALLNLINKVRQFSKFSKKDDSEIVKELLEINLQPSFVEITGTGFLAANEVIMYFGGKNYRRLINTNEIHEIHENILELDMATWRKYVFD